MNYGFSYFKFHNSSFINGWSGDDGLRTSPPCWGEYWLGSVPTTKNSSRLSGLSLVARLPVAGSIETETTVSGFGKSAAGLAARAGRMNRSQIGAATAPPVKPFPPGLGLSN